MNNAQLRVVRFAGAGAAIGLVAACILATFNAGGIGKAELFVMLLLAGVFWGVIAAWFANLR
ncbi:MAG: hypothetical protein ACT4QC_02335 [Planctomycetaceae bacterium]